MIWTERSQIHALEFDVPEEKDLLWCIGPPIQESFAQLTGKPATGVGEYIEAYRERFKTTGMFENEVYSGIPELLEALSSRRKYVATSKPHVFASEILSHFKLNQHFIKVCGSELDNTRSNKAELIAYLLKEENVRAEDAVMIGDRMHDVNGAKKNGVLSIGITWGYGSREELTEAGADFIVESPAELAKLLLI